MAERRHTWLLLAAVLTFVALLLAPAGARAQEDGVTVDPNSPSGKEYDIPTERARRDAGGGKKKSDDKKAPLFGEGVGKTPTPTPTRTAVPTATATATSSAPSAEAKKKAKARKEARRRKKAREAERRKQAREAEDRKQEEAAAAASPSPTPSPPPATNVQRVSDTDSGGFSSWALIGGMAVALVIVGTGGGLVLRRRFGST
jgi:hypothetical protein